MKFILSLLLFFVHTASFAETDTASLKNLVTALDKALVGKDSIALMRLLHPKVTYGHSNGWVETRADIITDLRTGYLLYEKLESTNVSITNGEDWTSVRMNTSVKGVVNKKPFEMQLYVLQVWKKMKSGWQLIGRQSAKL